MNLIFHKNSKNPKFWPVQLIGWAGFISIDFINNIYRISSFRDFLLWFGSDLIGFLITSVLRYIYKYSFSRILSVLYQFGILIVFSFFGGIFWFILRGIYYTGTFPNVFPDFNIYVQRFTQPQGILPSIFWMVSPIFGWSIAYFGLKYYLNLAEEKDKSEKMKLDAKNAQLQMLRYQINPHFLFNSLNSIKALTYVNPEQAVIMLTEFSEFLRSTLNYDGRIYVQIKEEIEIIEKYLFIEKIRFEERLDYKILFNKDVLNQEILCFITQPFVENAIKHGLTNNPKGIKITINFTKTEGYLVIEIVNNGVLKNQKNSNGKGIKNIVERLNNAYSDKYILHINDNDNLVTVRLLIPYKL